MTIILYCVRLLLPCGPLRWRPRVLLFRKLSRVGVPQGPPPWDRIRQRQARARSPASAQEEAFPGGVARPRGADVLGAHAPVRVPARRRREAGDAEVGSARTGVHVACRGGGATPGAPRSSTHALLYEACRAGPDEMRAAHIAALI